MVWQRSAVLLGLLTCCVLLPFHASAQISWKQWDVTSGGNGHWYAYIYGYSWHDAYNQAQAVQAHLGTLASAAEENWVRSNIYSGEMWIGFTDSEDFGASEGNWKWITHEPITYLNWSGGSPTPSGSQPAGQDFGQMNFQGGFGWDDDNSTPGAPTNRASLLERDEVTPELSSMALLVLGVLPVGVMLRRRKRT